MTQDLLLLPVIDSHVHLYPLSEVDSLAWFKPGDALSSQQHSVEEYRRATQSAPSLLGFIFVEADRLSDAEAGWEQPLKEVRWIRRIALGQPREDEGHGPEDARLCLGIVPWAPLTAESSALASYLDRVKEEAGEAWPKVKGFRFLLQDKPHGTMLDERFIDNLRLLGRRGFSFDVAIDHHRRGKKQLDELVEMVERAHSGVAEEDKVTFILDHFCKPDLSIYNLTTDPSFRAWRTTMYALSRASRTYIKLSGGFSEMPARLQAQSHSRMLESIMTWLGVLLATFGPSRIMFGSDWPICTAENLGDDAWVGWRDLVEKMCWMASLSDEDRAMIWGGTAKQAYRL